MKKTYLVTLETSITVEAEDEIEAEQLAYEEAPYASWNVVEIGSEE